MEESFNGSKTTEISRRHSKNFPSFSHSTPHQTMPGKGIPQGPLISLYRARAIFTWQLRTPCACVAMRERNDAQDQLTTPDFSSVFRCANWKKKKERPKADFPINSKLGGGVGVCSSVEKTQREEDSISQLTVLSTPLSRREKKEKQKEGEEERASTTTSASYLIDFGCMQKGKFPDKRMQKKNWKRSTIFRPFVYC